MIERTLVLIKPDGVQRGLIGEIIKRFEQRGLKIIGMKMRWVDKDFSKKHYKAHVTKDFYKHLEKAITEGPLVAMAVEGIHGIATVRKIAGATEPQKADLGSIRGDFAHISSEYANKKGLPIKNLVHASSSKEDADEEIKLWFKKEELHDYSRIDWSIMH